MENVGLVSFTEDLLKRGSDLSPKDRKDMANTNLHELAHHWFGNLVTMKWWNDLWLNESFATFVSFLVQTDSEELSYFKNAWVGLTRRKFGGIKADGFSSTHSVRNDIKSLAESEAIFDGISYGKGASYLKQVVKVMGKDNFCTALKAYFQKYKWQNAEYSEFIGTLQEQFDKSQKTSMGANYKFKDWSDSWLTTSGVNTLVPIVKYAQDESIESIEIK